MAEVYLEGNRVLHASVGSLKGQEAFLELLSWREGSFVVEVGEPEEVTLDKEVSILLLEGVHYLDGKLDKDKVETESRCVSLLEDLLNIPSVKGVCGYLDKKKVGNIDINEAEAEKIVDAITSVSDGFVWGQVHPWKEKRLVVVKDRLSGMILFFHLESHYNVRKLLKILESKGIL